MIQSALTFLVVALFALLYRISPLLQRQKERKNGRRVVHLHEPLDNAALRDLGYYWHPSV